MTAVVVTGGTGFLGRHLVRSLVADGLEVHVPTRSHSTRRPALPDQARLHPMARPSVDVAKLIDELRPTTVFHLATYFVARHRPDQMAAMVDSNVTLGTVVAESALSVGATLVHTTSAWQHFGGREYDPVSLYASLKQAFADVVRYFATVEGLDAREVCLFDTYGPDDDRHKLVDVLLDAAQNGSTLEMSSGRQLIDLTYVDDVVDGLRTAARTRQSEGGRFVVRSARPLSVRQLAATIEEVTGRTVDARWEARPDRSREMWEDWPVSSQPWTWRPTVRLEEGLGRLWAEREESHGGGD